LLWLTALFLQSIAMSGNVRVPLSQVRRQRFD
jgi:hypothetical protein